MKLSGFGNAWDLVDQRLDMLGEKPLGVLLALPDIEDPEHARVVVEPCRVCDQTLERSVTDLLRHPVVVRRRAIADGEFLDVDNRH